MEGFKGDGYTRGKAPSFSGNQPKSNTGRLLLLLPLMVTLRSSGIAGDPAAVELKWLSAGEGAAREVADKSTSVWY